MKSRLFYKEILQMNFRTGGSSGGSGDGNDGDDGGSGK
jgi:hypothetical protein